MTIGRMILIHSILTLLIGGTPQAANITLAGATNFPMRPKGLQRYSGRRTGTTRS